MKTELPMATSWQAAAGLAAGILGQAIAYRHRGKVELDWRKGFDLRSHSAARGEVNGDV